MRLKGLSVIIFGLVLSACATTPGAGIPGTGQTAPPPPVATAVSTLPATVQGATAAPAGTVDYKIVPSESQVTYTVSETFLNQNNRINTAIGVTKQVSGDVYADPTDPSKSTLGPIAVDISQFTSDSSRRDNMIRNNFLESKAYPLAKFVPTKIEGLPTAYQPGQTYQFKVSGDLTVKQTTKPVTFAVTAGLKGSDLTGTAVTTVKMSDFGVGPISLAGILNTQDDVLINFNFVARPGA